MLYVPSKAVVPLQKSLKFLKCNRSCSWMRLSFTRSKQHWFILGVQGAHDWAHYQLVITSLMSQTPWECFRSQDWAWCLCRKRNAFIPCLAVGLLLQMGNTEWESSSLPEIAQQESGKERDPSSSWQNQPALPQNGTGSSPTVRESAGAQGGTVPLTPRAGGSQLQLYHSFVTCNAFVNTGHTDNPLRFSCLIPTDYNLLTSLGSEWTTLVENHNHCFGDEEERTFNSKKLNKLLCALSVNASQTSIWILSLIHCNWAELCKQSTWDMTKDSNC